MLWYEETKTRKLERREGCPADMYDVSDSNCPRFRRTTRRPEGVGCMMNKVDIRVKERRKLEESCICDQYAWCIRVRGAGYKNEECG